MTEKDLAEDYRMVLHEAESMGCNKIKALYNIPLKNMEMIVQALEKQILKKPITDDGYFWIMYICPCCNNFIKASHNYCPNCGQKLDLGE